MSDFGAFNSRLQKISAIVISLAIVWFSLLFFHAAPASAAPGTLDPTFSGDGWADLAIGQGDSSWDLLYSGHRRVVVGTSDGNLFLAGIDPHGNLDPGFGSGGLVTRQFSSGVNFASGAVDSRGRLLIVVDTFANQSYLLRFSRSGQLDSGFGSGGAVQAMAGRQLDAVAAGPNGSIITAGHAVYPQPPSSVSSELIFSRWTAQGAVDPSFGAGGQMRIATANCTGSLPFGCGGQTGQVTGLGVQANGALVASANVNPACCHSGNYTDGLALVAADGRNDSLKTNLFPGASTYGERAGDLALQPDGRILVAASVVDPGAGTSGPVNAAGIARFMPDGTPDPSFDSDGFKYIRSGSYSSAYDVKLDRGRIYLAGTTGDGGVGGDSFLISRLLPSGSLDASFGGTGVVRTRTRTSSDGRFNFIKFAELIIDARGRPVIAGDAGDHIALVRYRAR